MGCVGSKQHHQVQHVGTEPKENTNGNNKAQPKAEVFKLLILGDNGVGKTCLAMRLLHGSYTEDIATLANGAGEGTRKEFTVDGKQFMLDIWDTAGQERFRTITETYYKNAVGALIVYDVSSRETFRNTQKWLDQSEHYSKDKLTFVLVGNKTDLSQREIDKEEAEKWAENRDLTYIETSAKDNNNIEEAFTLLVKNIIQGREGGIAIDSSG